MREIIIAFSLFIIPFNNTNLNKPKTCYCNDDKTQWTAYCVQQQWSCKKCCEYTKPKNKKDE